MSDTIFVNHLQESRETYLNSNQVCTPFTGIYDCLSSQSVGGVSIPDPTIGFSSCCSGFCPSKRKCLALKKNECFIGLNSNGEDPLKEVKWNNPPYVQCAYDPAKINTVDTIKAFENKFPKDKEIINRLYRTFCLKKSNNCPTDINTNQPMQSCSLFSSKSKEGTFCRLWLNKQPAFIKDGIKKEFCIQNSDSPDCACINRIENSEYRQLKLNNGFSDHCWYTPCSSKYALTLDSENVEKCPTNICQVVYDLNKNHDVILKNNRNVINCDFSKQHASIKPAPPIIKPPVYEDSETAFEFKLLIGLVILIITLAIFIATR